MEIDAREAGPSTNAVPRNDPFLVDGSRRKQASLEKRPTSCTCSDRERNLVVCIDGTWNQFGLKNTNVIELYSNLHKDKRQLTFYNSGIGIYARPSWKSFQFCKQVLENKADLAIAWQIFVGFLNQYEEDDCISLFGFSRGAYQVRALSAMIDKVGIYHEGNEGQIPFTYELYANEAMSKMTGNFKKAFARDARVHFVGAWDTVSSVGIARNKCLPNMTDGMQLVCLFRRILALDERRVNFLPEYAWGGVAQNPQTQTFDDQGFVPRIKEVWFSGTNSDISSATTFRGSPSASATSLPDISS